MLIVPAIDLLDGRPVRLRQGDYDRVIDVAGSPVDLAIAFAQAGAPWLHLVDLGGARNGSWRNLDLIAEIAAAIPIPVQAGGGVRTAADIEAAFRRGVRRVIVGTAAVETPARSGEWCADYGDRLAISLDVRDGRAMTRGWTAGLPVSALQVATGLASAGARCFVYTDVRRDGTLQGIAVDDLGELLALGVPVLVAGGVATYRDLQALRDAGAAGAIIGRALLEAHLDLRRAIQVAGDRK